MFQKTTINYLLLLAIAVLASCTGSSQNSSSMHGDHRYTNQLIHESSPYLLQHAHNPVDWYPWGKEALDKAEAENKLIIISIGYAACHWCHVMEHESFEDSTVAGLMNQKFVSIKVDREERPDIDNIYMNAAMLINGRGGWPLNVVALPNGKPVFAGTYYQKDTWMSMLNFYADLYKNEKPKLIDQADRLSQGIKEIEMVPKNTDDVVFREGDLDNIFNVWKPKMDFNKGGRSGAPKFPMPNNYEFLLKYYYSSGNKEALDAVESTLKEMAQGGIYDHLGGGFARYSTDEDWLVPHFEKMLYDNGQLVSLYSKAYQHNPNPLYKAVVYETLEFIKRELTHENGGFYSSLDADSEGEEGKFYVWTSSEIDQILGENSKAFKSYYQIQPSGNWEHGKNILHVRNSLEATGQKLNMETAVLQQIIDEGKKQLLVERSKRIRPGLDDKILTSWNALMLNGYVDAYRVFGEKEFLEIAITNAEFILKNAMHDGNRLNRNFKNGKSTINAFLDDYSLTMEALVNLYQATFDEKWLHHAQDLAEHVIKHFYDTESGMFFYTSDLDEALIARKMEVSDNVIPASNSSMARALNILGLLLDNKQYQLISDQMLNNVKESVLAQPPFYSNWAQLMYNKIYPPFEIAIVGNDWLEIRKNLDRNYLPDAILLGGKDEGTLSLLEFKLQKGYTTVYVCQDKICKMPVGTADEALQQMNELKE